MKNERLLREEIGRVVIEQASKKIVETTRGVEQWKPVVEIDNRGRNKSGSRIVG